MSQKEIYEEGDILSLSPEPNKLASVAPLIRGALDIHTMNNGRRMLKMNGFDVSGVFYFRPDVSIVQTGNSYECG